MGEPWESWGAEVLRVGNEEESRWHRLQQPMQAAGSWRALWWQGGASPNPPLQSPLLPPGLGLCPLPWMEAGPQFGAAGWFGGGGSCCRPFFWVCFLTFLLTEVGESSPLLCAGSTSIPLSGFATTPVPSSQSGQFRLCNDRQRLREEKGMNAGQPSTHGVRR